MAMHGTGESAAARAADRVAAVEDDPAGRILLLRELYLAGGRNELPYHRAALAFMRWQLRRGLLEPVHASAPGSPWWRAVNARLLRDTAEARYRTEAVEPPSPERASDEPLSPELPCPERASDSVRAMADFITRPRAGTWYRAHNHSVVSAYLEFEHLAADEGRVERFFINLALMRVLYAHALVAAPRLALGPFGPLAPPLGDPRLGMTAIFLSLSRVLPDTYPLGDNVHTFVRAEHGFGHLLDVGVILPRVGRLYAWSAVELGLPRLAELVTDDVPNYAWDPADDEPWRPEPSRLARWARRVVR